MKNSFLSGAVILMAANIISKVLGAVLKIPLTYIIHEEGMAVYNTAFNVYILFLSFVVSGLPFAVQKLTAAAHATGDAPRARTIVRLANGILLIAGLSGSLALWLGADFLALAMKEPRAVWAMRAIAPSVLLVALGTAVKSGFQGRNDMVPTAVSQVIEAFIKLFAGYYLAVALAPLGTQLAAAGAAGGVTVGEAAATLMLGLRNMLSFRGISAKKEGRREILREIAELALPLFFMSLMTSAAAVCDNSLIRAGLLRAGLGEERARFVYGAYTGYAVTVLNLPAGFLATLGISIVPVISAAAAVGDMKRIRSLALRGIGLSAASGIAAAAVLAAAAELILHILFRNTYSAPMLRLAAPSVIFICVMQTCGAILQSMGHIRRAVLAAAAAAAVKLLFSALLVPRPELDIYGAILGTDVAYCVGMTVNLISVTRALRAPDSPAGSVRTPR